MKTSEIGSTLSIQRESCIRCGRCVQVCPSLIFVQPQAEGLIEIDHPDRCIVCGHCVAACPTNSVTHSAFPSETVHQIAYDTLPSPEALLLLCKTRRSNRAFSKKPIPQAWLDQILQAAHRAPTASNLQQVDFTIITDPEKLHQISKFTIGVFEGVARKLTHPLLKPLLKRLMPDPYRYLPTFERMKEEFANGNDLVLRKATTVLLIHTPPTSRFGCEDANLAYQNGSLMAESLGVSQFYLGFVLSAMRQAPKGQLEKILGVPGKIQAAMGLGIPSFRYPAYIDRKEIVVTKME